MNAQQYFNSGVQKFLKNDFLGAIEDYTKAIELTSNVTQQPITKTYVNDGAKISETINVYEINEGDNNAYFNRGCAYLYVGKYFEALKDFDKVLEYVPGDAQTYFKRATVYYCLENDYYKSDLETAIKLDPKYSEDMFYAQWPK